MAAYLIANVKVTNESWIPDYTQHVHDPLAKHGGKYLSRSPNVKAIEGNRPDVTVVAICEGLAPWPDPRPDSQLPPFLRQEHLRHSARIRR